MCITLRYTSLLTILLFAFWLSVSFAFAQTALKVDEAGDEGEETECESKPFSSPQERKRVERENYECYQLRLEYGNYSPDSEVLKDINGAIQGLQNGLQFLQQLQSITNQNGGSGGTSGGNYATTPADQTETASPYIQSNLPPTDPLYTNGSAPSLYFQPSEYTAPTTTTVTFGQGALTHTYRVEGDDYIDTQTGEVFAWTNVQAREGLLSSNDQADGDEAEQSPFRPFDSQTAPSVANSPQATQRDTSPHTQNILTQLLTRPNPSTNQSNPLSPNLAASFSGQLTGAAKLFSPPIPGNSEPALSQAAGYLIFAGGIFAPIQNIITGASNGITAFISRHF